MSKFNIKIDGQDFTNEDMERMTKDIQDVLMSGLEGKDTNRFNNVDDLENALVDAINETSLVDAAAEKRDTYKLDHNIIRGLEAAASNAVDKATREAKAEMLLPPKEKEGCLSKFTDDFFNDITGEVQNPLKAEGTPATLFYVALLLLVHSVIMAFAETVFAVQALVVGVQTFPGNETDTTSCTFNVSVWMIVYGSFVFAFIIFTLCIKNTCCTVPKKQRGILLLCYGGGSSSATVVPGKTEPNVLCKFIRHLFILFGIAWEIYGMVLFYREKGCDASQFQVFSVMVQFLFYGEIIYHVLKWTTVVYLKLVIFYHFTKD